MPFADPEKHKAASRANYLRNKEKIKLKSKANGRIYKAKMFDWLLSYLLANPCVDCGNADPIVLEFDHREDSKKEFNIGDASKFRISLKRVEEEVAKCDVRCANCHRIMTYHRAGRTHRG